MVPRGKADEVEVQTGLTPNPSTTVSEPTSGTVHVRERSRSPRRHDEEPFGLSSVDFSHQFGFLDATLWCWRCGGWSPGSRRASRLKDPCGIPTKKGADVICRVSGGNPEWRSDDVSEAPERIPIIKNPYSNRYRPQVLIQVSRNFLGSFAEALVDEGMVSVLGANFCPFRVRSLQNVHLSC